LRASRIYIEKGKIYKKRQSYPCKRTWRPIGVRDIEAPTFCRHKYLFQRPLSKNINLEWNELKDADEVSGRRRKTYCKTGIRSWTKNMTELTARKRRSHDVQIECKRIRTIVKGETRTVNRNSWE
jgi:hypothetical protein